MLSGVHKAFLDGSLCTPFHKKSLRRIWCQGPRVEYRKLSQRINLAARCIGLLRPKIDVIILPGDINGMRELFDFYIREAGLTENQALWTKGTAFCMDDEISHDPELINKLKDIVVHSEAGPYGWVMVPYCNTPNWMNWAKEFLELGVSVVGDTTEWLQMYGSKAILHRHINTPDEPSVLEKLGAGTIRLCKGWVCDTVQDLVKAYISTVWVLNENDPEEVRIGGEIWTRNTVASAASTAKVYNLDYSTGQLTFGDNTNGKAVPDGSVIDFKLAPERLFPSSDINHLVELDYLTSSDKKLMIIKQYSPYSLISEDLKKGAVVHHLSQSNLVDTSTVVF